MHLSRVLLAISCVLLQFIPEVSCDGDLGTADYIAIGVSLGLTAFILAAMLFFLLRSRKRSDMDASRASGRNNHAVTGDNEGVVRGISMNTISLQNNPAVTGDNEGVVRGISMEKI